MDLDDISAFVKVVQAGSFSQAARVLGMPNTTVSAKVARLEKRLGVTLIQRTTRKLHVTAAGQEYFARCMRGLSEIEAAEAEISSATEPQGLLKITAPGDVAHTILPPIISRYLSSYPRTRVELIVTNHVIDLIADGVDLAIRAAELENSTLVARKFFSFTGGLWASPGYLQKRGAPKTPSDLEKHASVIFTRRHRQSLSLNDGRSKANIVLNGQIAVDDLETVHAFAVQGSGIGALPDFVADRSAKDGSLVKVLPQWTWTSGALSFVYPSQRFLSAKVRAFIDTSLDSLKTAKRADSPSS